MLCIERERSLGTQFVGNKLMELLRGARGRSQCKLSMTISDRSRGLTLCGLMEEK